MNPWLTNSRTNQAAENAFLAERAERRGDVAAARALHRAAASGFAAVALEVPADHPNTRSDLGLAALTSFNRAADLTAAEARNRGAAVRAEVRAQFAHRVSPEGAIAHALFGWIP